MIRVPDPTGGATHYHATSMAAAPQWAAGASKIFTHGNHIVLKNVR
ncbi:hypothetical protein BW687_021780 [Pseudomonas graminis]|nr:hypothetical protein [Pseudomonas graminis]MDC6382801.1 hypothetical protein [Pseudomonas graminis]